MTGTIGDGLTCRLLFLTLCIGKVNGRLTNFLSRNPTGVNPIKFDKIKEKIVDWPKFRNDWLLAGQRCDSQTLEIVKGLQNDGLAEDIANTYELRLGTLHRRIQRKGRILCVPIVPRCFR